jgi:hypothetical protein
MKKYNLYALVAAGLLAGGMSVTSASAADLGGNCCADLEERIAELEATTARKGNRKVSLTVSGWVGQQVTFWDDGVESNTYVHDLGSTLGSHVKFTGSAQISPGWSAGYVLQIEAIGSDSLTMNADNVDGPAALVGTPNGVQTLQSYWFVKSDQLGKIGVGKQSQASDNTAILVDGSGSLVPANWVAFDTNNFAIRTAGGGTVVNPFTGGDKTWGSFGNCYGGGAWGDCNGAPMNVVRYDSPTFGGFSVSASWGEDDMWDVAARYAGEWGGFKLAAAVAYNEITGGGFPNTGNGTQGTAQADVQYFQAGAFLMHVPTGLFAYGAYGNNQLDYAGNQGAAFFDPTAPGTIGASGNGSYEADTYYVKLGLRSRFSSLGHTVFYGEYLNVDGSGAAVITNQGDQPGLAVGNEVGISENLDVWGAGIVQEIDAAAMSVWVKYRHLSGDGSVSDEGQALSVPFEDFQYVGVGALINF